MQNTQGNEGNPTFIGTALSLQKKYGFGIFFDGIQPKLYRAAVDHSVTFYVYEQLMKLAAGGL